MARNIQNKNRITETRENLEKLLVLLKKAENDEITLAQIGRECDIRPQALNTELQTSFAMYFKSRIRYIEPDDLSGLIDGLDTPADRLLKRIFEIRSNQKVVFPDYDEDKFWSVLKKHLSDKYYTVVTKHIGYNTKAMNYEKIGKELGLTRSRIMQIDNYAIAKLRNSSVLVEIFYSDYIDKVNEIDQYKADKITEFDNAYTEFTKLKTYLALVSDVKAVNKYIATNYPNITADCVNDASLNVFNKSIDNLNFSARTNNALTVAGYNTINDLYSANAIDLINIKNLGKSSIKEIIDVLDAQKATHPNWKSLKADIEKVI